VFYKVVQTSSNGKTMKKTPFLALALMPVIMIPAIPQLHAVSQTIDGVVTGSSGGVMVDFRRCSM
jgi:hypothetical protein